MSRVASVRPRIGVILAVGLAVSLSNMLPARAAADAKIWTFDCGYTNSGWTISGGTVVHDIACCYTTPGWDPITGKCNPGSFGIRATGSDAYLFSGTIDPFGSQTKLNASNNGSVAQNYFRIAYKNFSASSPTYS